MNKQLKYVVASLSAIVVFSLVYEMVKFLFAYLFIYLSSHAIDIGFLEGIPIEWIVKLIAGCCGILAAIFSFKAGLHAKTWKMYRR